MGGDDGQVTDSKQAWVIKGSKLTDLDWPFVGKGIMETILSKIMLGCGNVAQLAVLA